MAKNDPFPARYWWLVLVAVPIAVAIISALVQALAPVRLIIESPPPLPLSESPLSEGAAPGEPHGPLNPPSIDPDRPASGLPPLANPRSGNEIGSGDEIVYVTATGTKYHLAGCGHLTASAMPRRLAEVAGRYQPCLSCMPPVLAAGGDRAAPGSDRVLHSLVDPGGGADRQTSPPVGEQTVWVTASGSKYHQAGCHYLTATSRPIPLSEARRSHTPCKVCRPPGR